MSATRGAKAETTTGGSCGHDWSVAKKYKLFSANEDDLETVTKKAKEHHRHRKLTQVRRCHAPNTFGTVNMKRTVDLRLSWSE